MRVTVSHDKSREEAMRIVDDSVDKLMQAHAGPFKISDFRKTWHGQMLDFTVRASLGPLGVPIKGTVEVTDTEIIIVCHLPALLTKVVPEKSIQAGVENRLRGLLRPAPERA